MAGLYITQRKQNKKSVLDSWWLMGIGLILLATVMIKKETVKNGLHIIANKCTAFLTGKTGSIWLDLSVQGTAGHVLVQVLFGILFLLLLYCLIKYKKTAFIIVIFTVCIAGYGIGLFENEKYMFLLLLGLCVYLALRYKNGFYKKENLSGILLTLCIVVGVCLCGSAVANAIVEKRGGIDVGYARMKVASKLHALRYDHGETVLTEGNLSNVGHRTQSKETALLVTMEHPQKMYLRQMIGDIYTGNSWESLDANDYRDGKALFYWLHRDGFYAQNVTGEALALSGKKQTAAVKIKKIAACEKSSYLPYAMKGGTTFSKGKIGDADMQAGTNLFSVYIGNTTDWYKAAIWISRHQKEKSVHRFLQKEEAYRNFVYDKDLRLTNTAIGTLDELLKSEKDKERTLTKVLKLVHKTISHEINYNEAVQTDNGKSDFLRYTLNQTKNGYDVHYATAATLMLRYLGVPARYVEGYYISSEDALHVKAGKAQKVQKKNAHAWAEYYLDGVGWIPFEVTPGYRDKKEEQELSKILTGTNGNGKSEGKLYQKTKKTYESEKEDGQQKKSGDEKPVFRGKNGQKIVWIIAVFIIALFLLAGSIILYRRRKRLLTFWKNVEKQEPAKAIPDLYGYSEKLRALCLQDEMDPNDNALARYLNEKARFSGKPMTTEEKRAMLACVGQMVALCKNRKDKWRRFADHYIYWRYR